MKSALVALALVLVLPGALAWAEDCTNGDCEPDPPDCTNGDCPPGPPDCTNGDCPPANEGICDDLMYATPGLYGLCVAYCEAQDCEIDFLLDDPFENCNPSSEKILRNYNRKKTEFDPDMPCLLPNCPCFTYEEAVDPAFRPWWPALTYADCSYSDYWATVWGPAVAGPGGGAHIDWVEGNPGAVLGASCTYSNDLVSPPVLRRYVWNYETETYALGMARACFDIIWRVCEEYGDCSHLYCSHYPFPE